MEPKIVSKPGFTVTGMLQRGKMGAANTIPQLWTQFGPRMHTIPQVVHPEVCYGLMDHYDEQTGEFDYVAACEVESNAAAPDDMVRWEVPAQTYAVFTTTLPQVGAAFDEIYQRWLPASGYRHAASPEFECYGPTFDPANPSAEMEIYIPISKN